jgi:hypothetical protein
MVGSPVLMNAGEMQSIADQLFVGNKLTSGELRSSNGLRVDLRNIKSPIIVFCSWGDDITPPPQALHWTLDLYDHENEIVAAGQGDCEGAIPDPAARCGAGDCRIAEAIARQSPAVRGSARVGEPGACGARCPSRGGPSEARARRGVVPRSAPEIGRDKAA